MRLLILFTIFSFHTFAQDVYYVSHIEGKVRKVAGKKYLVLGQALTLKDSLIFNTHNDYVSLISPVKGSRTARFEKVVYPSKGNEIVMCLKDMLVPSVIVVPTAARGGVVINSVFDFENYIVSFADQHTPFLIIDSLLISLGPAFAVNTAQQFFYARYRLSNQDINKKLSFRNTRSDGSIALALNDSIFMIDGKPVRQADVDSVRLYYYNAAKQLSLPVGMVRLEIVTSAAILEELCVIKTNFQPLPIEDGEAQLKEALFSHLLINFGKVDNESAERIFKMLKVKACK